MPTKSNQYPNNCFSLQLYQDNSIQVCLCQLPSNRRDTEDWICSHIAMVWACGNTELPQALTRWVARILAPPFQRGEKLQAGTAASEIMNFLSYIMEVNTRCSATFPFSNHDFIYLFIYLDYSWNISSIFQFGLFTLVGCLIMCNCFVCFLFLLCQEEFSLSAQLSGRHSDIWEKLRKIQIFKIWAREIS